MSMMGGRDIRTPQDVGETVAQYPDYTAAQKAVGALIEADIPAREISIVWAGLRAVEMITGRLGYARAAWSGALNGAILGLLFGAVYTLVSPELSIQVLLGCMLVGTALGMVMQLTSYALVRRRREFSSVTQPVADHYDVAVAGTHVATARRALAQRGMPGRVVSGGQAQEPATASQPGAAQTSATLPPPRYGVRVDPATNKPVTSQPVPEQPASAPAEEPTSTGDADADAAEADGTDPRGSA